MGILDYLSQTDGNIDFVDLAKDLSLLMMPQFWIKHVPLDINSHNQFLTPQNFNSQVYLEELSKWTEEKQMKLYTKKYQYMIFNFSKNHQFSTRLEIWGKLLEQVSKTKLFG